MQVRFWGVRGSIAVPSSSSLRYGGNTACVEVTLSDGSELILDAGTGVRDLGAARTGDAATVQVLLTHLHLDHIQGLLFFAPLFDPANEVVVYGPPSPGPTLEQRLARYLSEPLSPVELRELPARVQFAACPYEEWQLGCAQITAAKCWLGA
jgi:phosphoribosyl 1,2-cyclic phosphodiesterase